MHARAVADAAAGLTAVVVALGVVLAVLEPVPLSVIYAMGGGIAVLWAAPAMAIARRPTGRVVGVLMALVGFTIAFTTTKETAWAVLAARPELQPGLAWLVAILSESAIWLFAALALLLLYFPDGRLPSARWRFLPPAIVAAALVRHASGAFDPTPFRPPLEGVARPFGPPPPLLDMIGSLALPVLLLGVVAAAVAPVVRFRVADPSRRAQLKWLGLVGIGVPGFVLVCGLEIVLLGAPSWASLTVAVATAIGLPVAIAIAVLRHELYDVDRAVSTAVTYLLATGIVASIFLVIAAAAGVALGRDSALVAAAGAALAVAALAPVRRALQRRIDRRLYPLREAALEAVRSLERRTHSGAARPEELEQELRVALRDPGLRLAYRLPGASGLVDHSGTAVAPASSLPIVMGGSEIGVLMPSSDVPSPGLLREVARASGTLVEIVRLRLELNAAVRELEASRVRIVQVGDEERRRLERDLHDGAQQRLVSLGMSLRIAQRHLGDDSVDVHGLIDEAVAELGTAVAELRQIAHGLRPSRLDDGLAPALTALSRGLPVPVEVDVTPADIPDDLVTTIYFVASEALANAVKHAGATRIGVRVVQSDRGVEVSVRDDGRGGATVRHGSGLAGLHDRVAALGGTFAVETATGGGTIVHAVLPCAS